jgi:hypothetical protein
MRFLLVFSKHSFQNDWLKLNKTKITRRIFFNLLELFNIFTDVVKRTLIKIYFGYFPLMYFYAETVSFCKYQKLPSKLWKVGIKKNSRKFSQSSFWKYGKEKSFIRLLKLKYFKMSRHENQIWNFIFPLFFFKNFLLTTIFYHVKMYYLFVIFNRQLIYLLQTFLTQILVKISIKFCLICILSLA